MKKAESPRSGKWTKDYVPEKTYAGKNSNVAKEAEKSDTATKDFEPGSNVRKRKSGGRTARKEGGKVEGSKADIRADRAKRKSGGMCNTDWEAAQGVGTRRPKATEER